MDYSVEFLQDVRFPRGLQVVLVAMVTFLYCYHASTKVRFYVNWVAYVLYMNFFAVVMIPVFMLRQKNVKNLMWVFYKNLESTLTESFFVPVCDRS